MFQERLPAHKDSIRLMKMKPVFEIPACSERQEVLAAAGLFLEKEQLPQALMLQSAACLPYPP